MIFPNEELVDSSDVKLLLCFVICNSPVPVSRDVLLEALQSYGYVNYFDAAAAFTALINEESICEDSKNKGYYLVTSKGRLISQELKCDLPSSVREKALAATINLLSKVKNEKENFVNICSTDRGYSVRASISGGEGLNFMSIDVYVPNEDQAKLIKKNFLDFPQNVYECLLAVLTKNSNIVKNILSKEL